MDREEENSNPARQFYDQYGVPIPMKCQRCTQRWWKCDFSKRVPCKQCCRDGKNCQAPGNEIPLHYPATRAYYLETGDGRGAKFTLAQQLEILQTAAIRRRTLPLAATQHQQVQDASPASAPFAAGETDQHAMTKDAFVQLLGATSLEDIAKIYAMRQAMEAAEGQEADAKPEDAAELREDNGEAGEAEPETNLPTSITNPADQELESKEPAEPHQDDTVGAREKKDDIALMKLQLDAMSNRLNKALSRKRKRDDDENTTRSTRRRHDFPDQRGRRPSRHEDFPKFGHHDPMRQGRLGSPDRRDRSLGRNLAHGGRPELLEHQGRGGHGHGGRAGRRGRFPDRDRSLAPHRPFRGGRDLAY